MSQVQYHLKRCHEHCDMLGVCRSLPDCEESVAYAHMAKRKPAPKGQSHAHSWLEAAANIGVGFAVSLVITAYLLPAFGHHITLAENVAMTSIFTVASLARSYALRRIFNRITTRGNT